MADSYIKEKDNVIFKRNDACRAFQIRKNRQVYFEKNKFSVDELIGQTYGSTFEIDKGRLVKVDTKTSEFDSNVQEPSTDNRDLQDLDSNQKLSKDDIMKMKEEGVAGEKIIEELIENSETFKNKTEFSQAKYLKKKKKRHIVSFTVLRPTPRLVLKIFAKEPQKICNLRADTLSQMLNYSNIMCGSNVAVVETCQGLVLSCILQRLGGQGKLIQLIPSSDNQVCRKASEYFGFSKIDFRNVYSFPMSVLTDLKENHNQSLNTNDDGEEESQPKKIAIDKELDEPTSSPVKPNNDEEGDQSEKIAVDKESGETIAVKSNTAREDGTSVDDSSYSCDTGEAEGSNANEGGGVGNDVGENNDESKPFVPNREMQRRWRAIRHKEAADLITSKKLDSLIIACKYNPTPIVKNMLEFLQPSRPVVVYCQYLEPLVEIYTYIKERHLGLQLKLSETWLREYQILPQRTHPMMNMSGNGGYLLTFTTCAPTTC